MTEMTAQQVQNVSNALIDYYIKGKQIFQNIQEKPLLEGLREKQKRFTPGKGQIKFNISGDRTSNFAGYAGSDTVSYVSPANLKQCSYNAHKNLHTGLVFTYDDFRKNGISISEDGSDEVKHSERDEQIITDYIQAAIEDQTEGTLESFNSILWGDGSASSKNPAGILSILTDNPESGVVGGIDGAANDWWRHRTLIGSNKITASATNQTLTLTLQKEIRQLRRYGGKPDMLCCGSDFLDALLLEINAKGLHSQDGLNKKTDLMMGAVTLRGIGTFMYDPTLDDIGYSKRCYAIDTRHLHLYTMDKEDFAVHSPARPAEKYVVYKAITWSGADIVCKKRNAHAIWEVA